MANAGANGNGPHADGATQDYDGAFEMLRTALLDVVEGKATYDELRAPVRTVCIVAREHDVRAEQMLVRFKEMWSSLPPLADQPRGRQRNDLMARVATICIEEFYSPAATNGARGDGDTRAGKSR